MFNQPMPHHWTFRFVLTHLLLALTVAFLLRATLNLNKITKPEYAEIIDQQQVPEEISPEGIAALSRDNLPYMLINADDTSLQMPSSPGPARLIYYTTTPSFRSAQELVAKDRRSKPASNLDSIKLISQRLTGTPSEWQRLNLTFLNKPIITQPLLVSPSQLVEAVKSGVDLQVIDLRWIEPGVSEVLPSPKAIRWMPHEVLSNLSKLSKEKWIVLIGYSKEGVQPIAWELFQKGYLLTTVLDGDIQRDQMQVVSK